MAAPLFTTKEIEKLLAMPKHVRFDDWQSEWKSRNPLDEVVKIRVHPGSGRDEEDKPEHEGISFLIVRTGRAERGEINLTMHAALLHKKPHPICRYDIQNGSHTNPRWYTHKKLRSREPHRHVYNPRCVRDGVPADWDACAEPLPLAIVAGEDVFVQLDRLTQTFLKDLHIEFFDTPAQRHLYQHDVK